MAYSVNRQVFEILELFEKAKTKKEKLKVLKDHEEVWALRDVLRGTFDDLVQWNLPGGEPPYVPNVPESPPTTLLKQHVNFAYFVRGVRESEQINKIAREKKFIDMLESIHPEDAKVLVSMINKKPHVKGLTKKIVEEAYPDLIPK